MNFTDQTVIVTGAGSGIGRAAALRFADLGANVVIADKNEAAAREVADEAGAKALAVTVDVSDSASVRSMIKAVVDNFGGGIDVLCNNAGGFGFPGNVLEIDEENWDRLMSVNLKGVYLCSKYAIPELAKTGDGRIVNTSSYTPTLHPRPSCICGLQRRRIRAHPRHGAGPRGSRHSRQCRGSGNHQLALLRQNDRRITGTARAR